MTNGLVVVDTAVCSEYSTVIIIIVVLFYRTMIRVKIMLYRVAAEFQ